MVYFAAMFPRTNVLSNYCLMCSEYMMPLKTLSRIASSGCSQNMIRSYSQKLEARYKESDKAKILKLINESEIEVLSRFSLTKGRIKNIIKCRQSNGNFKTLSEVEFVDGFSERIAQRFFDSVITDNAEKATTDESQTKRKVKGQLLNPPLADAVCKSAERVVAVQLTGGSVGWCGINTAEYRLSEWGLLDLAVPDGKKLLMSDLLDLAHRISVHVPPGSLYVLEAPATTLRAAGGDPNNPRVLTVNLQRAQLVAALVAIMTVGARHSRNPEKKSLKEEEESKLNHTVYFLRANLQSRLFRTLVGNERVTSEYTVLSMFNSEGTSKRCNVSVPDELKTYFLTQRDIEKEVLGQCLLLGLAFMEVCFYKNPLSIAKLVRQNA